MEIYKNLSLEDLPNEEWRDVVGYEGLYKVSNLGRVKSVVRKHSKTKNQHTNNSRIIKQQLGNSGYLSVHVSANGKRALLLVHRQVCLAFCDNKENLPCVNHKDENKLNNMVENLEFCTHKYNSNYGTRNDRILATLKSNSKYSKKVFQYTKKAELVREWDNIHEISESKTIRHVIYKCCIRKRNSGYGYLWRFSNDCDDVKPYKLEANNKRNIQCFDKDMNLLKEYNSVTDAANDVGASIGNIVSCCKGRQRTSKGYIFKYKNN